MLIKCNVLGCGYNSGMFCSNKLICITNTGQCKRLTKPNWEESPEEDFKEKINIVDCSE